MTSFNGLEGEMLWGVLFLFGAWAIPAFLLTVLFLRGLKFKEHKIGFFLTWFGIDSFLSGLLFYVAFWFIQTIARLL
jgi:hypothetical protein